MLSSSDYKALVEKSPVLVWRANRDALFDYFNERWLEYRGRSMEQEAGRGWVEGIHPENFDHCLQVFFDSFHHRRPFQMEYRLLRHDGEYRWMLDSAVPFVDESGTFAGFIGSCLDITAQVEAQEALRAQLEDQLEPPKGIIPICSCCKKIRDDNEIWQPIETYFLKHSESFFSHGLCPDCFNMEMLKVKGQSQNAVLGKHG